MALAVVFQFPTGPGCCCIGAGQVLVLVCAVVHVPPPLFTAAGCIPEIWSHILSGWPSVTDSEVNRNVWGVVCSAALSGL